jgi:pimeloyl-ACP methyl ester carboxylesterase
MAHKDSAGYQHGCGAEKMIKRFVIILLILINISCSYTVPDAEKVFIRYKNADMPVWVRGNTGSGVFIIYLHGGPGGSSVIDLQNGFFQEIEENYAMIYYDQRGSGMSMGQSSDDLFTLEQFTEDLDVIVDFVDERYKPSNIILMGHSWGGTLGTAYLINTENSSRISGWIEVDGGHNLGTTAFKYSRDFVLNRAQENINTGKDTENWQDIIDFYYALESWRDPKIILEHSENVTLAGGYFFDESNREGLVGLDDILFSDTDYISLLMQNKNTILKMDVWHYDFTSQLSEINLPTLLLWGEYDGILPVKLAYEARTALGLNDENFHVFMASGHSPHYEETELFNKLVIDFIIREVQ